MFTNAGHLPPLWYRSAQREWSLLQDATAFARVVVDLPLGLIAGTPYSQTAIQLEPGDMLILYTDGINESCNESGKQLGLTRLLAMARELPTETSVAAGEALLAAIEGFRGEAPAADDETVMVLQRPPSVVDRTLAA